jgi:osmoprotectant transport system substrate-binding protein
MRTPRTILAGLALGALLTATACAGDDVGTPASADKGAVTISGQDFPEATLVANMYKLLLEDGGYTVSMKLVGTRDVYMSDGQFPGSVDVVPEYVGGIADFLNVQANGSDADSITTNDPAETLSALRPLADKAGITLLEPSDATDQNAFFVTQDFAQQNSLTTLSDLGDLGKPVVLAAAPDCKGRTDCEGGLSGTYGIDITKVLPLGYASAQTFKSVLDGESQLGETSTTDGSLESQGLVLLEDDKGIQPAQNLVPAVSTDFLEKHGDVEDILNGLMAELTTEDLTTLNGKISNDREQPEDVAKQYLEDKGLLS